MENYNLQAKFDNLQVKFENLQVRIVTCKLQGVANLKRIVPVRIRSRAAKRKNPSNSQHRLELANATRHIHHLSTTMPCGGLKAAACQCDQIGLLLK